MSNKATYGSGSLKRPALAADVEAWPPITTNKEARAYAEACFQGLKLDMSARLLLHLMACKWHSKRGWRRAQRSIARLMGATNKTATHALKQLLELGVIYEAEPASGKRAPVYDFGPNRADVLEPLRPTE
ncbi:hypothetical protein [Ruegeria sp. Alg231-54]|uniref:hypothetical protein n=1 Tax=Ruegeria sp. Alg231-54 TaxID=1922221 RepID=UPI000D552441|nr:hypothetical protein [Ruegeria sp. Alg231-54]